MLIFIYFISNFTKFIKRENNNIQIPRHFAFKYASINEYDITIIDYENYYFCDNRNMNTPTKFEITKIIYSKRSPRIDLSYFPGKKAKRYN